MSLLVGLVSIAAAPMAAGNATLTNVVFVDGKGVVFTFHVDHKFSRSELRGNVWVDGGGNYGLDCLQVDSSTVKCNAPQAVGDSNVVVTWGGFSFWTRTPKLPPPTTYCYSVWDWDDYTDWDWIDFGPHCQDEPAQTGDQIEYTVPGQDGSFTAWYSNGRFTECSIENNGPAYYKFECQDG
jgi:hypothetical protein